MMGPISLEDTGSRLGVFRILFSLEYFAVWGVQIWKPWFNRTVMDWMRGKSGEESEQFAEP